MTEQQLAQATLEFLQRAPLEGREAETMVLCKQWVRKQINPLPPPFGTGSPQVADTIEK